LGNEEFGIRTTGNNEEQKYSLIFQASEPLNADAQAVTSAAKKTNLFVRRLKQAED